MKYKVASIIPTLFLSLSLAAHAANASNADGVIKIKSAHSVAETINKLEAALTKKGMTIFKRIDHTAGAKKVGMQLRPTVLLIFGNPKVGTPLMLCSQMAALDLPQKALAYEDTEGNAWLSYNDPAYIENRHNIKLCTQPIEKIRKSLANFSKIATQ